VTAAVAFGIGGWLAVAMDGTASPILLTQAFFALMTAAVAFTLVRWHGDVVAPPPPGTAPATR
jgi:DHA1 family bicyclomycin/chloramphenicol resistance-like MFS transporter